tara:strand:+ start:6223 stop:8094 length:1872 start_codon:yes stop_codon:yes gene_type:complete
MMNTSPIHLVLTLSAAFCAFLCGTSPATATPFRSQGVEPQLDSPNALGVLERTHEDLHRPTNLAYGPDGTLWVVDGDANEVVRFRSDGYVAARLKTHAPWLGPSGIAVSSRLYVSDQGHAQVVAIDADIRVPTILVSGPERAPESVRDPAGICVGPRGLAVADPGLQRVLRKSTGDWRAVGEGLLRRPIDVTFDDQDNLYVLDAASTTIEVFDAKDTHVRSIGGWGFSPTQMVDPLALHVHGEHLLVADPGIQAVRVLDLQGNQRGVLAPNGRTTIGGHWGAMSDLAVTADGKHLAICEPSLHRVRVFGLGDLKEGLQPIPTISQGWRRLGLPGWDADRMVVADRAGRRLLRLDAPEPGQPHVAVALGDASWNPIDGSGVHLESGGVRALVCERGRGELLVIDVRGKGKIERTVPLEAERKEGILADLPYALDLLDVTRNGRSTWVLCGRNRCVIELDTAFRPIAIHDTFPLPLLAPVAVTSGPMGRFYVVDHLQGMAVGLEVDGSPLDVRGRGRLLRPTDAHVDDESQLWIFDRATSHISAFRKSGSRETHWTGLEGSLQALSVIPGKEGTSRLFLADFGITVHLDDQGRARAWDDWHMSEPITRDAGAQPLPVYDPAIWVW